MIMNLKKTLTHLTIALIIITIIEYSIIAFYDKSYSYYGLIIPIVFYYIFMSIQKLMYQSFIGQRLSIEIIIGMCINIGLVLVGMVRINFYLPIINFIFGTGGMLIIFSCLISMFKIKTSLVQSFSKLDTIAHKKLTQRFAVVGSIFTCIYLVAISLLIFKVQ